MSAETSIGLVLKAKNQKENVGPNNDELDDLSLAERMAIERFSNDLDPLKEDVAEWLARVLDVEIKPETLLDSLDNGVLLCKLAQLVQKSGEKWIKSGKDGPDFPPFNTMKYHNNAKSKTFFARDNTAHFLQWCKGIGVQESVMFVSDGLVLHRQPREVVLCLLDVARFGARVGIEPPNLIKLEHEIDREIAEDQTAKPKKGHRNSKTLKIDSEVARLAAKYNVRIEQIKEGRYIVEGKINIFVRVMRKHIMVRVGGGWDTLEHFISRHDPNKLGKILTSAPGVCHHHHHGDIRCKGVCHTSS